MMSPEQPERMPGTAPYAPGWERTDVARPVAIMMSVLFAAGLLVVPVFDAWSGGWHEPVQAVGTTYDAVRRALAGEEVWWRRLRGVNRAVLAGLGDFEAALEDSSAAVETVRPTVLGALLHHGGAGSEEVYMGRDGWIFYRPDVDALARAPSTKSGSTAEGLAAWAADLAERGVRLVFVPLPGKAAIHPEQLAAGRGAFNGPLVAPGLGEFPAQLAAAWQQEVATRGLESAAAPVIFDPAPLLWSRKKDGAQFLRTDSHWTPGAMEAVADELAEILSAIGGWALPEAADGPSRKIQGVGDTARMLELGERSPLTAAEAVEIKPVAAADGSSWQADRHSPVLLLGDSYTNIYSTGDLGWGESAGLAEQLSHRLGFAVDRLARNDAGALEARRMVTSGAARHAGWLEGKKVLVWPLAMREVAGGDWRVVEWLQDGEAAGFLVLGPGEAREVTATVAATGPLPPAGRTPYDDYLTAVHLTDIDGTSAQAVAYIMTMKGRKLLPVEGLVPGRSVRIRLSSYEDRAAKLDPLNRGELEDIDLLLESPNFAEWIIPEER